MTAFSLPDDSSPQVQRAYQYWQQIAPVPGRLPGRQHFDPLDIPSLLPHVWLVDVSAGPPPVFRYRLLGTAVDRAMGRTHTGQRMDEVMPDFFLKPEVCGPYLAMLTAPQPNYRKGVPLFAHNRLYHALERILLPMARDGITVDMLFCVTLFYMPDGTVIGLSMSDAFILPTEAHALIRQAFDYWTGLRPAPDRLPGRQHVEPTAIPKLLSHIWMVDVHHQPDEQPPLRFRYRLLGTAVRRVTDSGETVVGRWLDEVDAGFNTSGRYQAFATPALSGQPGYRSGAPAFPLGLEHLTVQRLFMPLAADGSHVDMLFCVSLFLSASGKLMDPG